MSKRSKLTQAREDEELLFDRILQEGLRLKKKVKTMSKLLAEGEAQRQEIQQHLHQRNSEIENLASILNATHVVELQKLRDVKTNEIEELKRQLSVARLELQSLPAKLSSLSQTVAVQQEEMNKLRTESSKELALLKESHANEIQQLQLKRDDYGAEVQRSQLLRRALIAEAEIERLSQAFSSSMAFSKEERDTKGMKDQGSEDGDFVSRKDHESVLDKLEQCNREKEAAEAAWKEAEASLFKSQASADEEAKEMSSKLEEYEDKMGGLNILVKEQRDVLQASQQEICNLQETIDELVRSKDSVESAVTRVLSDNEELRFKVKMLSARQESTHSPFSYDPTKHYRSTSSPVQSHLNNLTPLTIHMSPTATPTSAPTPTPMSSVFIVSSPKAPHTHTFDYSQISTPKTLD